MRDGARWRNWGRNQQCSPAAVETPTSELEVVEAVQRAKRAGQTVKVVGAGHSFTGIACTDGRMLRLGGLNRVVAMDRDAGTVTVEGGGSSTTSWRRVTWRSQTSATSTGSRSRARSRPPRTAAERASAAWPRS
jgi:hypothetical protein